MTPEAALKKRIMNYLGTIPEEEGFFWRASDRFNRGIADIGGVYRGRAVWLEAKIQPRKATALQGRFLSRVLQAGGIAGVVYSVGDVMDILGRR